ncbi:MAG: hypothetical protein HPY59_12425 [Anaerolineae bacterium]|nr:hypothetical protein [Anaerolineae bacterium]
MSNPIFRIWGARFLIGIVIFFNLECALVFILTPHLYIAGFELTGIPGKVMVQGLGILFLMWNVPYISALISPVANRLSLYEALIMQTIGLIGESLLLVTLPSGYQTLKNSALRFILFDGAGLFTLLWAAWLVRGFWHTKLAGE